MRSDSSGYLVLEDGRRFRGELFGSMEETSGEVVFNTGMVGYVEAITDPSYRGQILSFTYPMMGNYGVPEKSRFESDGPQVRGVVVSRNMMNHSHWESKGSLGSFLKENGISGICGIDTRALTKHLRSRGTMLGRIEAGERTERTQFEDPNRKDLGKEVTVDGIINIEGEGAHILLVDCGCKESIVRSLVKRGCSVTRVPYDRPLDDLQYDGVLISNGPGDPKTYEKTLENVRALLDLSDPPPIAGICLGNQIMALAAGASTYKLKFGHRSQNQPCKENGTRRCIITSQNHGFAVEEGSLPGEWDVWYRNLNDGTVEGIKHRELPLMAVQFHPEASPGPTDPNGFFDDYLEVVTNGQ